MNWKPLTHLWVVLHFLFLFFLPCVMDTLRTLEKEMATHSSVLAWRIPGTGERGGLLSVGSHRVGHDWRDLAANIIKWKCQSLSHVWFFATPQSVAYQASLSMEFSGQKYWNGLPCPSLGNLPNPGIEPRYPTLQVDFFIIWATRAAQ